VSKQLGHADINITLQTYAHLFEAVDLAAQAREALDAAQSVR
jgi:integrase